jgi:cbb3-type cytochrome oxidase subunit 3
MSGFAVRPVLTRPFSVDRALVLLASIAISGFVFALAAPVAAQDEPVPTPTSPLIVTESNADPAIDPGSPVGEIIPGPNSGARPERPGDRGGSLQLGLFALLLTFLAVAAWRVAVTGRRGRRAYAERARAGSAETSTGETDVGVGASDGPEPLPRGD